MVKGLRLESELGYLDFLDNPNLIPEKLKSTFGNFDKHLFSDLDSDANIPVNIFGNLFFTTDSKSRLLTIGQKNNDCYKFNAYGIPVYSSAYNRIKDNLENDSNIFFNRDNMITYNGDLVSLFGGILGGYFFQDFFGFLLGSGFTYFTLREFGKNKKLDIFSKGVNDLYNPNYAFLN